MSLGALGLALLILGVILVLFTTLQTLGWAGIVIGGVLVIVAAVRRM